MIENIKVFKLNTYLYKLKEIFEFLINPNSKKEYDLSGFEKVKHFFVLFIIGSSLSVISAIVTGLILGNTKVVALEQMRDNLSPSIFLLIGVLIAPLLEEIIFRLSLIFKPFYLSASIAIFSYYKISDFLNVQRYSIESDFLRRILIAVALGFIVYLVTVKFSEWFANFWKKNFRWIYYASILSFAWVHISNFELTTVESVLMGPLLTLPQLIGGIFKGFIRIKYGFLYNLIYHWTNNFIVLSLGLIM